MASGEVESALGIKSPADPGSELDSLKGGILGQATPTSVPIDIRREPEVNKLFRMVMKHQGSDLHLKVGAAPMMRLRGTIRQMEMKPLTQEDMERLMIPTLTQRQRNMLEQEGGIDYAHVVGQDEGRFRVNLFRQRGKWSVVAR